MTLAELRTELLARGANYLDASGTTRQDRFLNRAYDRVCNAAPWPFLWTTTTGTAPLNFTDMRNVRSVVDTDRDTRLRYVDQQTLIDEVDADLTTTGVPEFWYITDDDTLAVYPANTSTNLKVWYVKYPTHLSAAGDTPIIPTRFHLVIVDAAMVEVMKDSDDYQLRAAVKVDLEETLEEMRESLLAKSYGDHDGIRVTSWGDF